MSHQLALIALIGSLQIALLLVPDINATIAFHPTFLALIVTMLLFLWIVAVSPSEAIEFTALSGFLLLMPTVYLASLFWHWFLDGDISISSLIVEGAGQVVFAAFAALGFLYNRRWLAAGIFLHGIGWDAWHYQRTVYVPDWYALACLVVDTGWACYIWLRFQTGPWSSGRRSIKTS